MTKPEAEVLAHRLARVWAQDRSFYWDNAWQEKDRFYFKTKIDHDVFFAYHDCPRELDLAKKRQLFIGYVDEESYAIGLVYVPVKDIGLTTVPPSHCSPLVEPFAAQWMDFFRRGCWLCGYDIDATAHEKAEWAQGFASEELEAWDLKF